MAQWLTIPGKLMYYTAAGALVINMGQNFRDNYHNLRAPLTDSDFNTVFAQAKHATVDQPKIAAGKHH